MTRKLVATLTALALLAVIAVAGPLSVSTSVRYVETPAATKALVLVTVKGEVNATYGVEVRGPDGEVVAVKEVTTDGRGLAFLKLELIDAYPEGTYTVYVSGMGENVTDVFQISWDAAQQPSLARKGVEKAASNLIRVASKLQELVYCRNKALLEANVSTTEWSDEFGRVANLTAEGDNYLTLSRESLNSNNFSAALRFAHLAIRRYGTALEIQEKIKDAMGLSFAACRAVLAPEKEKPSPVANKTCKWTPDFHPLMAALNVTRERIRELEDVVAEARERGYNVTGLAEALERAKTLVEEARNLAVACNVSSAARKLAEAKKLVGFVNSAIAKLGDQRIIKEMVKQGIDVNETEIKELRKELKKGRIVEKIAELINKTLERIRNEVREKVEKKEENKGLERRIQNLEKLSEKLREKAGNSSLIEKIVEKTRDVKEELSKRKTEDNQKGRGRGK